MTESNKKTRDEIFEERKEAIEGGKAITISSTVYQKETLKVTVKIRMPENASIKDLIEELKRAQDRLNQGTEFRFTIALED